MVLKEEFKLDPVVKEKWVSALRSGEYHQGIGNLKNIPEGSSIPLYCCLGVYCEVTGYRSISDAYLRNYPSGFEDDPYERPIPQSIQSKLSDMNDGAYDYDNETYYHADFNKIADWIEENL